MENGKHQMLEEQPIIPFNILIRRTGNQGNHTFNLSINQTV